MNQLIKRDGETVWVLETGPMDHRAVLDLVMDLLTEMDAAKTAGEIARGEFQIPEKQCPMCEEFKPIAGGWNTTKNGTPVAYCIPCMKEYRKGKEAERRAKKKAEAAE